MTARERLLAEIEARELRDALARAAGWTVCVYHIATPQARTLYGPFREPAEAMAWAEEFRRGLVEAPYDPQAERDEGWRCDVVPIMPAPSSVT